jgi:hypothetical protein
MNERTSGPVDQWTGTCWEGQQPGCSRMQPGRLSDCYQMHLTIVGIGWLPPPTHRVVVPLEYLMSSSSLPQSGLNISML